MLADRYIGMDIHKKQVAIAAVDDQQRPLFAPEKVDVEKFEAWAINHLRSMDHS